MTSQAVKYDPTAARNLLTASDLTEIEPRLLAARDEVFRDVELLRAGGNIPAEKQPLDAGFVRLPSQLLDQHSANRSDSLIGRIQSAAAELCEEIDRLVVLGIGGSYMGARALFEALCHPFHNELTREQRHGIPRVYFEGNNLDNDTARGLIELLQNQCDNPDDLIKRWGVVVISKSGGTLETAAAFRLFRDALENYYGAGSTQSRRYVIPITGEQGKLRELSTATGYPTVFPIPNDVGGRFSIFTAVGLVPAALLGLNIEQLLEGAATMTERFQTEPLGQNPVLDYTAVCHLLEDKHGLTTRVLSTWGSRLEAVGFWYDQLLSESLGKQGRGATPITAVNTRDLHSRGQQHQEGRRDKLITNLIVESPTTEPIALPVVAEESNQDGLNRYAGKTYPNLLSAAIEGTNKAYADAGRPTTDLLLPRLDEHALGQLLQMLMLATVLEGRLIGINPYGQPGVEAYKKNMTEILRNTQ